MPSIASERERRIGLWHAISEGVSDVEPQTLRGHRIYGGAQGIWVDKTKTGGGEIGPNGATVSILHTGRHYPDDLSDDGVIYHYPQTARPAARDAAEILATKNAMELKLPIFIILPAQQNSTWRSIRLGWVADFDDENKQFLILFGSEQAPLYSGPSAPDAEFRLTDEANHKTATVKTRPGQQRFRFQVMSQYGQKCAVCQIRHPQLLIAAHICGKSEKGSDDWRNGLPLCATHHEAFDSYLFGIEPESHVIYCAPNVCADDIGLVKKVLSPIRQLPHRQALTWRWSVTMKVWSKAGYDPHLALNALASR